MATRTLTVAILTTLTLTLIALPVQARGHHHHRHHYSQHRYHHHHRYVSPTLAQTISDSAYRVARSAEEIVSHPAGCPRSAFCGCGVSVRVFGHPVRELYLASNWFRYPRTSAAPGMVAVRNHHVMYIMAVDANGNATVYDPNSGGHQTRVHVRSLSGYSVRDPRGGRYASR